MRSQSGISPAHSCSLQTHVPGMCSAPAPWFLSQPFPVSYPRHESANRPIIVYDRVCRGAQRVGVLWCKAQACMVTLKKSLAGEVCSRRSCCWSLECCYHSLKPAPVGGQSRRHWKSIPHLGHPWKIRSEVETGYSTPPFRTAIWYCLILNRREVA